MSQYDETLAKIGEDATNILEDLAPHAMILMAAGNPQTGEGSIWYAGKMPLEAFDWAVRQARERLLIELRMN